MLIQSRAHRLRGTVGGGLLVAVVGVLLFAAQAWGAPVPLVVDTTTPQIVGNGDDGKKVALEFTNLTDGPVALGVRTWRKDCRRLKLEKNGIPPSRVREVSVEIPASCATDGLTFRVMSTLDTGAGPVFEIEPEAAKEEDEPSWGALCAFPVSLFLSGLLVLLLGRVVWSPSDKKKQRHDQPLTYYDPSSWKFSDSWATNVTAIGALLTGLLSASTVKPFLGEDAESALALGTISAAVAISLVGAAPVILIATKKLKPSTIGKDDKKVAEVNLFTVGGLLAAFWLVTSAGFAQLWVVSVMAREMDLAGMQDAVPYLAAGAAVLLLVYVWRSVPHLLEQGTQEPDKKPESKGEGGPAALDSSRSLLP